MKTKLLALAAALLVSTTPLAAHAAVDRAVIEEYLLNQNVGNFTVGYLDGGTLMDYATLGVAYTGVATGDAYQSAIRAAVQADAVSRGYTLSNGIFFPSLSKAEIQTLIATSTPAYWHNGASQASWKHLTFATTTTGGQAVVYLTDNGQANGNALCTSAPKHINVIANDSGNTFGLGYAVTNSNKTLTVTANVRSFTSTTVLGITVLGSSTLTAAPNGTAIGIAVDCN